MRIESSRVDQHSGQWVPRTGSNSSMSSSLLDCSTLLLPLLLCLFLAGPLSEDAAAHPVAAPRRSGFSIRACVHIVAGRYPSRARSPDVITSALDGRGEIVRHAHRQLQSLKWQCLFQPVSGLAQTDEVRVLLSRLRFKRRLDSTYRHQSFEMKVRTLRDDVLCHVRECFARGPAFRTLGRFLQRWQTGLGVFARRIHLEVNVELASRIPSSR